MQTRKYDPAFPIFDSDGSYFVRNGGLSKREFFAIISLQGILSSGLSMGGGKNAAELAVRAADLLIVELNKTPCEENLNGEDQGDE